MSTSVRWVTSIRSHQKQHFVLQFFFFFQPWIKFKRSLFELLWKFHWKGSTWASSQYCWESRWLGQKFKEQCWRQPTSNHGDKWQQCTSNELFFIKYRIMKQFSIFFSSSLGHRNISSVIFPGNSNHHCQCWCCCCPSSWIRHWILLWS